MSELTRMTMRPEQSGGRPCIRGLRVRVKDVLDLLATGASREEILGDYPYLESADITPPWNSARERLTTRSSPWPDRCGSCGMRNIRRQLLAERAHTPESMSTTSAERRGRSIPLE